ncbi:MAG: dethiobiotin synthase [Aureisphaera sp.]
MRPSYFITGISTDVGKTVISAILTEALEADYWKPVQAGELDRSDLCKIKRWVANTKSVFHDSAYNLNTPMSPHAAAEIDGVGISIADMLRPNTKNTLVIEGAGGLLVPLNDTETVADLILPSDRVIVVSRHYLGSINHTLTTIECLKARNLTIEGIIFSGAEHPTTEGIIEKLGGVPILGRIDEEPYIDRNVIKEYAEMFREILS